VDKITTMNISFTKMHGLGNDFMVIDAINQKISLSSERIKQLSDRHFGVVKWNVFWCKNRQP
jgi:diaminopimelate epimerase